MIAADVVTDTVLTLEQSTVQIQFDASINQVIQVDVPSILLEFPIGSGGTGSTGDKGPTGDKGIDGNQGIPGDKGLTGDPGTPSNNYFTSVYDVSDPDGFQTVNSDEFTKIIFVNIVNGSSYFNSVDSEYQVQETGTYEFTGTFRPVDNLPAGMQFGVGVHTSEEDGSWFLWHSIQNTISGVNRTTYPYTLVKTFNQGDLLRMFCYFEHPTSDPVSILSASMQVRKL